MTEIWKASPPDSPPTAPPGGFKWGDQVESPDHLDSHPVDPRFIDPREPAAAEHVTYGEPPLVEGELHRRRRRSLRFVVIALSALVLLGVGFGIRGVVDRGWRDVTAESGLIDADSSADASGGMGGSSTNSGAGRNEDAVSESGEVRTSVVPGDTEEPVAAVAEALSPAVVQIQTTDGLGSGVIYDGSGLIMTNAHVVGRSRAVSVLLADGNRLEGEVLGADAGTDIAVVRVNATTRLTVAPLASDAPKVGQMAVALGSPFGLDGTVTQGIVSAVDRPVDNQSGSAVNMIQTDAAINPGNSGGALANRYGEVIGINSSIYSMSGDNSGIGFAVPISMAKSVADRIVGGGSLDRAGLGITGTDSPDGNPGAYVVEVLRGGSAEGAGIREGDLITAVDGVAVKNMEGLRATIGSKSPGDEIVIVFSRDGHSASAKVTLGSLSDGG